MRPYLILPIIIAIGLSIGLNRCPIQAQNAPGGNGYASVSYTVSEDISAPSYLAGSSSYNTRSEPTASDVINTMVNAGATIGDATCTMTGYDKYGRVVASGIFVWSASFNRTYKN